MQFKSVTTKTTMILAVGLAGLSVAGCQSASKALGMTVADWWGVTKRPANALFMGGIDAAGFYDLLTERLARL